MKELLSNVGAGGGAPAATTGSAATAAAGEPAPEVEEKKEEKEEESDEDMVCPFASRLDQYLSFVVRASVFSIDHISFAYFHVFCTKIRNFPRAIPS